MMTTVLFLLPATTLLIWATCVAGERIGLSVNPHKIEPGVTQELTIGCSGEVLEPDDDSEMKDVISLVIERMNLENSTNETIATVSIFANATALQDKDKLKVSGNAEKNQIHIELIYTDPDEEQVGTYRCTLHGLDFNNTPLSRRITENVSKVKNPVETMEEMANKLKDEVDANKAVTEFLAQGLDQLGDNVENLKGIIEALDAEVTNIKAINEKRFQALEQAIQEKAEAESSASTDSLQLETADFVCYGNCSKWVQFAKPFMSEPQVLTFIRGFQLVNVPNQTDSLMTQVRGENTTGFNLEVWSNADKSYISWLAVAENSITVDETDE